MFFTNMILYDLCVFATLRAKFHAKAQRRKVYCHYLDCWYELRTVIKENIKNWIQTTDFDAVIWTNLPEKLNLENVTKTEKDPDGRIDYLQNLKGFESALAEEYIRNTPKQIATKYRNQIIKTLGWE